MQLDVLNLLLLVFIIILLFLYLFIRIFFTTKQFNHQVPIINSGNDVISNLDLSKIITHYQTIFRLQDYEIKFVETENFYNLNKGLNRKKKTITFSKTIFPSVGYEIDYLIGTLWFIHQCVVMKNNTAKFYNFVNRFGFNINLFFLLIFAFLSLAIYLIVWVTYKGEVEDSVLRFLWNVPIFQILVFLLFLNAFVMYLILTKIKPTLEAKYGAELSLTFNHAFKEYSFDLTAARNYATQVPLPHDFSFHSLGKWKWLGPFVKH